MYAMCSVYILYVVRLYAHRTGSHDGNPSVRILIGQYNVVSIILRAPVSNVHVIDANSRASGQVQPATFVPGPLFITPHRRRTDLHFFLFNDKGPCPQHTAHLNNFEFKCFTARLFE